MLVFSENVSGIALEVIDGSRRFECWFLEGLVLEFCMSILGIASEILAFGRWRFEGLLLALCRGTSGLISGCCGLRVS